MNYLENSIRFLLPVFLLVVAGCSGEKMPFTYNYKSASVVEINYNGKSYVLQQFGPRIDTPFKYEFEPDGDLDITVAGKSYDIDSPYDRDVKKKKVVKKVKKPVKKSTKT